MIPYSNEGERDAYERGLATGQDSIAHKKENTKRFIAALVALSAILLCFWVAYGIETSGNRDAALKEQCYSQGGVWTTGGCAWSKAVAK